MFPKRRGGHNVDTLAHAQNLVLMQSLTKDVQKSIFRIDDILEIIQPL